MTINTPSCIMEIPFINSFCLPSLINGEFEGVALWSCILCCRRNAPASCAVGALGPSILLHQLVPMTQRNLISWTTMISGYVQYGVHIESLELFGEMRVGNVKPDEVALIKLTQSFSSCTTSVVVSWNTLLDGYCRSEVIDKTRNFFNNIPGKDLVSWNTMINCHARFNCFEEQFELFRKMQSSNVKPNSLTLIDPLNDAAYVLLSNIYAEAARWDDVSWVRTKLEELGVKKKPGCSLIEQNGVIHEFVCRDFMYSQSAEVYSMLDEVKERSHKEEIQE
ncbi:pentatricopeptide repeat-containing protein At5g48910-like [Cornus florida]|uniref:pentatricopeptide repeat-containing protein At5g48910-like n=1 Tax=Cornus florida TaxID=4283 RepID=UPI00289C7AB6|nr:pentatricopeptide repeat-containing protein At5g48910-like [Cornus florida]